MQEEKYRLVADHLKCATRVCVITHLRPDADAIGSATALAAALRACGKEVEMVIGQKREVSRNFLTIPLSEELRLVDELPGGFDVYVTVDCGSLGRAGSVQDDLVRLVSQPEDKAPATVVCIDHHSSNEGFGHVNLVDTDAESTTVAIHELIKLLGVEINQDIAHSLYAGLVTDTGSFRWGRASMHDLAASLVRYGLDTKQIALDLLDSTTPEDLKMLGQVLSGIRLLDVSGYRVAVLVGHYADLEGHPESAVEALVDHVRSIEGTDIAVVFKEQHPGHWAVSLRSSVVDCSALAVRLGGGGHVPAAGYSTDGTEEEIIAQLCAVLED